MMKLVKFFIFFTPLFALAPIASAQTLQNCQIRSNLSLGSRGVPVICLQQTLVSKGYVIPSGATGYFGTQTKNAVAAWQKNSRISPASGYFGPTSRRSLSAPEIAQVIEPVSTAAQTAWLPVTIALPSTAPVSEPVAGPSQIGGGLTTGPVIVESVPVPVTAPTVVQPVPQPVAPSQSVVQAAPTPEQSSGGLAGTVTAPVTAPPVVSQAPQGEVKWSCDFENDYCGMYEQSKTEPAPRSSFVGTARSGSRGIMLTTLSGDNSVHGSGDWERDDLALPASSAYCNAGQEEWWSVSVYFPQEYVVPQNSAVMDFHHNASGGQANFHITSTSDGLHVRGFYGDIQNPSEYRADLGSVEKGKWYDFVFHVKWSEANDGLMVVWMNGKKVLTHNGPTLYPGISCYLKLANYHSAFGAGESIIFDRIIRGTSADAVSLSPLE